MKTSTAGVALLGLLIGGPLAHAASSPRILVIYDMEGVSGIDREAMTDSQDPAYAAGRTFLTSDVNAAIRGLKAGGAGAIWVEGFEPSGLSSHVSAIVNMCESRVRQWLAATGFAFRARWSQRTPSTWKMSLVCSIAT